MFVFLFQSTILVAELIFTNLKFKTMKKFIMTLGVVALIAGTTSCKKDYTCDCMVAGTSVGTTTITDTKSNAIEECDKGDGTAFGITVDCEIQ